jgi:cell wall-associated NlpC family hydrolase
MADQSLSILGQSSLTASQIQAWYTGGHHGNGNLNTTAGTLIGYYVTEGNAQGVRGDVAFAQACLETNYFQNQDTYLNNYAGIGHPVSAPEGLDFASPQIGVRAQIQLLAKVVSGNNVKLVYPDVAPSWGGKQTSTWAGMSANWAQDTNYASKVISIYNAMLGATPLASAGTAAGGTAGQGQAATGSDLNNLTTAQQKAIASVLTGQLPTVDSTSTASPFISAKATQWVLSAAGPDIALRVTTDSTVDLSTSELSQVQLTVVDPDFAIVSSLAPFVNPTGTEAALSGQFMQFDNETVCLSELGTVSSSGVPAAVLTMRTAFLNWASTQRKRDIVSGVTASDWVRLKIAEFNSLQQPDVTPIKAMCQDENMTAYPSIALNTDLEVTQWQSYYDMAQQLCQNEGAWLFEVGGVVVFARPEWLVNKTPAFTVQWLGLNPPAALPPGVMVAPIDIPVFLRSQQLFTGDTCVLQLPHDVGEQVRPGHTVVLAGCGLFDTDTTVPAPLATGQRAYQWLVTDVQWNYDAFATPVQVTMNEALNPVPAAPGGRTETYITDPTGNPGGDPVAPGNTSASAHGSQTASAFVAQALTVVGDRYSEAAGVNNSGGTANEKNPNANVFDCSSLVQWALYQVGVTACPRTSGDQYAWAKAAGSLIPVEQAINTAGALVFLGYEGAQHVAISLGGGNMFVEAENPTNGVRSNVDLSAWTGAALVPGLIYPGSGS